MNTLLLAFKYAKRKEDFVCVYEGKERGNRLDYILCFKYKGNIIIKGKRGKKIREKYAWHINEW